MGFRKLKNYVSIVPSESPTTIVKVSLDELVDGVIITKMILKEVSKKEIKESLPDPRVYTLENLLASGVDLQQLPVGHLLDDYDLTNVESYRERISTELYNLLLDLDYEQKNKTE